MQNRASITVLIDEEVHVDTDHPVIAYDHGDDFVISKAEFPGFGSPGLLRSGKLRRNQIAEISGLIDLFTRLGKAVDLIFLIDSKGGHSRVESELERLANKTRAQGGTVWSFNREQAMSAAGWMFVKADKLVSNIGAEVLLHQWWMCRLDGPTTELKLGKPAIIFRRKLISWIEANIDGDSKKEALEFAIDAFKGPNPLDDVRINADDLERWGLIEQITETGADFANTYLQVSGIPEYLLPQNFKEFLLG